MPAESLQRALWRRVESIHAVTYFGEESRDAASAAGLRGFWMGYFGFRGAPLGAVSPETISAAFFNYAPAVVARSVPDVWAHAEPDVLIAARSTAAAATLRRLSPAAESTLRVVEPMLIRLGDEGADQVPRPLFSANREVALPDDPVARLWHYTTLIREHRGDGHVHALVAAGLDGCQALALISADVGIPAQRFRESRGWTEDSWAESERSLIERGLLSDPGTISAEGTRLRSEIEATTDHLAAALTAGLDDDERLALMRGLDALSGDVSSSGLIPFPNPIGLPDPST